MYGLTCLKKLHTCRAIWLSPQGAAWTSALSHFSSWEMDTYYYINFIYSRTQNEVARQLTLEQKLISMSEHWATYLSLQLYSVDVYSEMAQSVMSWMQNNSPITEPYSITDHSHLEPSFPPLKLYFIPLLRTLSHMAHICDSINVGHIYLYIDILPLFPIISLLEQALLYTSLYMQEHSEQWSANICWMNLMCIPWMSADNFGMWPLLYNLWLSVHSS